MYFWRHEVERPRSGLCSPIRRSSEANFSYIKELLKWLSLTILTRLFFGKFKEDILYYHSYYGGAAILEFDISIISIIFIKNPFKWYK